ncbi:aarF domain-containing protein kinase 1-like [Actinia tenebrosa]|uniref:AarF domain-containing protein kinase 1-like n=1 Tax=Actinia tenebrosa TaxID=6105 RepID=A0A6P8I6M7_ACTTE|nr:aarF domain-containing protein kinase 1-like [Actinia tenebrosa]
MTLIRNVFALASPAVVVFSSCALCSAPEPKFKEQSKFSSNGLVRCGRTVLTVILISYDYKKSLWGVERNGPEYKQLMSKIHWCSAARLRELCCANGGIYIKGAQYIGALDFLLPYEYVKTMKVFHSDAPQSTLKDVYKVLEEDLGQTPSELFSSFDPVPLGTASLAQVHKATMHDGKVVAVKVQHKDIQEHVSVDIYTIELLTKAVSWIFPEFRFKWLIDETKRNLPLEMDFLHEGRNSEKVTKMFSNCKFLKVPKVLWKLSSKRVLMMEFCEGGKVDDLEYMRKHNISSDEVSKRIGELYSEMIFVTGYVHCDPHPGNVLVKKDLNDKVEIVLLDHGLYQQLSDDFRVKYCKLWQCLIASDVEGIKQYSNEMGVGDLYGLFACVLTSRAWSVVTSGIDAGPMTEEEVSVS